MGKKLTIFMIDGTPEGPMTVEIGNWSGLAFFSPRGSLKEVLQRSEFDNVGIYILRGQSPSRDYEDTIYIGETELLRKRLNQQLGKRDFESVVCVISKDSMLTKAHVKYLESRLIQIARDLAISDVENDQMPPCPKMSEGEIADMETFIEQIKIVLPTVGFRSFMPSTRMTGERVATSQRGQVTYDIKSNAYNAKMIESVDGFIVLQGSEFNPEASLSISDGWKRIRKRLVEDGTVVEKSGKWVFAVDTTFNSPSAASSVVLGRQAPGPVSWVDQDGITYKVNQENLDALES